MKLFFRFINAATTPIWWKSHAYSILNIQNKHNQRKQKTCIIKWHVLLANFSHYNLSSVWREIHYAPGLMYRLNKMPYEKYHGRIFFMWETFLLTTTQSRLSNLIGDKKKPLRLQGHVGHLKLQTSYIIVTSLQDSSRNVQQSGMQNNV